MHKVLDKDGNPRTDVKYVDDQAFYPETNPEMFPELATASKDEPAPPAPTPEEKV